MDTAIDLVRRQLNRRRDLDSRFIRLQRLDCDRGQEVPDALASNLTRDNSGHAFFLLLFFDDAPRRFAALPFQNTYSSRRSCVRHRDAAAD